jgi:FAD/FMN-containing dehydrogenase
MTTHPLPDLPIDRLRAELGDRLVLPGEDGYDEARQGWNRAVDQRPAAVVRATSVADVRAVVRHARAAGLRVAPQATGHGSESLAALHGAILLKTAGLDAVAIDPVGRTATIGAGATAGAVAAAAGEHGLAPVLGLAPSVGATGLSLGGGLGWLSRSHGLAASNVRAVDVVTADGEARRVDARHEADLFWALRGGGGRGAIVTSIEVALHPVDAATAGMIAWPAEHAAEVLEQVRRFALDAPDCVSVVFRVLSLPPLDVIPEPIRGRRIVAVVAAHLGPHADAERFLAPLRTATGAVLIDTIGPVGPADLVRVAGDPEEPGPARGDGLLIADLTPAAVGAVAAIVADDALEALGVLEVRQLGGAVGRRAPGGGALDAVDARFAFFAGGFAGDAGAAAAVADALADVRARLAPFAARQVLLSASGGGIDPATGFAPGVWERLVAVRDAYDPDRLILTNHDG